MRQQVYMLFFARQLMRNGASFTHKKPGDFLPRVFVRRSGKKRRQPDGRTVLSSERFKLNSRMGATNWRLQVQATRLAERGNEKNGRKSGDHEEKLPDV